MEETPPIVRTTYNNQLRGYADPCDRLRGLVPVTWTSGMWTLEDVHQLETLDKTPEGHDSWQSYESLHGAS